MNVNADTHTYTERYVEGVIVQSADNGYFLTTYISKKTSLCLISQLAVIHARPGQWRRQLGGTGGTCPPRLPTISVLVHFLVKKDSQLSKYCVVCEISWWCRCQQLTALSISITLVTKLLVIEQLLHPALKFAVSAP